ncbi:MAG TPA: amidohydrolase family protein, partial [Candidatus Dormibacteraeota bacterium]|nr:amidohydrolase family protein [Candidatus Dormibacteraeota bacterium]
GGGALPTVVGRLARAWDTRPEARARLVEPPDRSWRRFLFDTVTHDAALLAHLVAFAGADHVLLGSDRPFDMGTERPVEAVRRLGLPDGAEALILGGNAERLFTAAGAADG